jgi:hypothetical protein
LRLDGNIAPKISTINLHKAIQGIAGIDYQQRRVIEIITPGDQRLVCGRSVGKPGCLEWIAIPTTGNRFVAPEGRAPILSVVIKKGRLLITCASAKLSLEGVANTPTGNTSDRTNTRIKLYDNFLVFIFYSPYLN